MRNYLVIVINLAWLMMRGKKVQKIGQKSSKKGVYNKYPFEARKKLISMVEDDNRTLASSAKELGICQTTARLILSTWREQGRVFEKRTEKEKRMKRQAKRQAKTQRKIKRQRQRSEIEQGDSREEGPNVANSQKPVEFGQNIRTEQIQDGISEPQLAENPGTFSQHLLQTSMPYQLMEYQGIYYLQLLFNMPTQFGWH